MRGKRILITGGAGSIGSELTRQLYKKNRVYVLDFNEMGVHELKRELGVFGRVGDIRNRETLRNIFEDFKPHIVFHAAAYKSVDEMEYIPSEARETNITGTENVLDYSKIHEVEKFVFISTDKVVNATSIMGQSKKYGETITTNSGIGYIAVRFGNVIGSTGSLFEIWQKQLSNGSPITVTDKRMTRYFMTIPEAVDLLIQAAHIGRGGEIICFDMGKPVNIYELGVRLVKELGRGEIIESGIRAGEVLEEHLMSVEEERLATKVGKFYILHAKK